MTIATDNYNPYGCCWDPPIKPCCIDADLPVHLYAELDGQQGCDHIDNKSVTGTLLDMYWDGESKWVGTDTYSRDLELYTLVYEFYCDGTTNEWKFKIVSCNETYLSDAVGLMNLGSATNCTRANFHVPSTEDAILDEDCGCILATVHEVDLNFVS